jgi:predicted dehydrogenase
MQISLVGAGYWGSKLKAELETIPGVEDIEIIDIKDGKDLKDIKYDNVILATPAWDHYQQTVQLLQQGKNLYVEKPLALTTAECIDIKQNIKEQVLMVGHIFLYNDRVKKIKELLPRIGRIRHIESNRLNWGRFQKKISTLYSLAPHDVSIIHYLLGYHKFKNIKHIGHKFNTFTQNDRDEFEFECDSVSVKFNLSWYYPEKIRTMVITGELGTISWDEEKKAIKLMTDIWKDDRFNYEPTIQTFHINSNPLSNELKEFVNCVKTNKPPYTDVDNAIAVAKNLDLLSKSLIQD